MGRSSSFSNSRTFVRDYDGSWVEYGSMLGVPIEA
jgi:3-mercaptopyruvate sulfurtransferase SseA